MVVSRINSTKIEDYPYNAIFFFAVMMRLEFALKDRGYAENKDTHITLNLGKYADQELGNVFFNKIQKSNQASELICSPPKIQKIHATKRFTWKNVRPITNSTQLLYAIWRVRNNLFHGSKGEDTDHDRSEVLIEDASFVLEEILQLDDELYISYSGQR